MESSPKRPPVFMLLVVGDPRSLAALEFLHAAGADLHAPSATGQKAFHLAAHIGDLELVPPSPRPPAVSGGRGTGGGQMDWFIGHGADVNARRTSDGCRCLPDTIIVRVLPASAARRSVPLLFPPTSTGPPPRTSPPRAPLQPEPLADFRRCAGCMRTAQTSARRHIM
jgi:hypothetical protein